MILFYIVGRFETVKDNSRTIALGVLFIFVAVFIVIYTTKRLLLRVLDKGM